MTGSDATFRELFVELPAALLEVLQGIGERAAEVAQVGAVKPPSAVARITVAHYVKLLMRRYGWREAETRRIAHDAMTHIIVTLECGHRQRYEVDEMRLLSVSGPAVEIALLDSIVDSTPRRCFCVERPR